MRYVAALKVTRLYVHDAMQVRMVGVRLVVIRDLHFADVIRPTCVLLAPQHLVPGGIDTAHRIAQIGGRAVRHGKCHHEHGALIGGQGGRDRADALRAFQGAAPGAAGAKPLLAKITDVQFALVALGIFQENKVVPAMLHGGLRGQRHKIAEPIYYLVIGCRFPGGILQLCGICDIIQIDHPPCVWANLIVELLVVL